MRERRAQVGLARRRRYFECAHGLARRGVHASRPRIKALSMGKVGEWEDVSARHITKAALELCDAVIAILENAKGDPRESNLVKRAMEIEAIIEKLRKMAGPRSRDPALS